MHDYTRVAMPRPTNKPDPNNIYLWGDDPMTCPLCCTRTDFVELPGIQQLHQCRSPQCGFIFYAEPDEEEHE